MNCGVNNGENETKKVNFGHNSWLFIEYWTRQTLNPDNVEEPVASPDSVDEEDDDVSDKKLAAELH